MAQEFYCNKSEGNLLIRLHNLHESSMGYTKGAIKQYRDSRPTKSIHVREFDTKYGFHYDDYNPEQLPFEHFFNDVLKPESVLAAGLAFVIVYEEKKNWKSALWWALGIGTLVQFIVDN